MRSLASKAGMSGKYLTSQSLPAIFFWFRKNMILIAWLECSPSFHNPTRAGYWDCQRKYSTVKPFVLSMIILMILKLVLILSIVLEFAG